MKRKRIRLKKNATWKQKQAAWLARQRGYQRTIRQLRIQAALMTRELDARAGEIEAFEAERAKLRYRLSAERKAERAERAAKRAAERAEQERRHREQVKNWQIYDKAYVETSAQELALFEASPAYQKYQQWRQTK